MYPDIPAVAPRAPWSSFFSRPILSAVKNQFFHIFLSRFRPVPVSSSGVVLDAGEAGLMTRRMRIGGQSKRRPSAHRRPWKVASSAGLCDTRLTDYGYFVCFASLVPKFPRPRK
jgi:hypothetical protein